MKIQCSGCEAAEVKVLCCADDAALCLSCDAKIHAANKLASKHQRVPLSSSSSPLPKCDICQETAGYFFCLEDRALLCRKCDFSVHMMNSYVSRHQRFLLTGVKAGLAASETNEPSFKEESTSSKNIATRKSAKKRSNKNLLTSSSAITHTGCDGEVKATTLGITTHKQVPSDTASGNVIDLPKSVSLIDSIVNNSFAPGTLSKDRENDSVIESEWSKILRLAEEELLHVDKCTVSEEFSWTVPQLFSNYPVLSSPVPGDLTGILLSPQGSIAEDLNGLSDFNPTKRRSYQRYCAQEAINNCSRVLLQE